jgi:excinuclease ABC subunit B
LENFEYGVLDTSRIPKDELSRIIKDLEIQMRQAAESLEFERAAGLRDQIYELRQVLVDKEDLPPWQRAKALSGDLTRSID